ncbi:hypothetical protein ACE1MS_22765 (plasmid) [Lysinibacillus sp. fkY74-1]
MSIELIGPQGYEYQYIVTALVGLSKLNVVDDLSLVIEKSGGEDAELTLVENGERRVVEIQVKSTSVDLGLQGFTEWLAHFEDHKAQPNLLSRVENDHDRYALFVTRARCTDDMRNFCTDKQISKHELSPLASNKVKDMVGYLQGLYTGRLSPLKGRRKLYCEQQSQHFNANKTALREVMERVIVWEQLQLGELENLIYSILNKDFLIPQSNTYTVLLYILDAIKKSRDKRGDVIPLIREILKKNAANRIFLNPVNVFREETTRLIEQLKQDNVLLLTGVSYCGKTHTAEYIATYFQDMGFYCKQEKDISEAYRFLINEENEDRLCILEDPFGHLNFKQNTPDKMEMISKVISKLRTNRKLIVTSRKDLLKQNYGLPELNNWKIDKFQWNDLSVEDKSLMFKVWEEYSKHKALPKDIIQVLKSGIERSTYDQLLQPGQLRYLAYKELDELKGKSFEELYSLANEDARNISAFFSQQSTDFLKVILVLGCGATTISPIFLDVIRYILSKPQGRLSIREGGWDSDFDREHSFPVYPELRELTDGESEALDLLETRGFIQFDSNHYRFTHPTYLEAVKQTIKFMHTGIKQRIMIELLDQGMFCLHPKTAFLFTRNIESIYIMFEHNTHIQQQLVDLAYSAGTKSIFPAVRDIAITFLIKIIEQLDHEKQRDIIDVIQQHTPGIMQLKWEVDIPWLGGQIGYNMSDYWKAEMDNFVDVTVLSTYLDKVTKGKSLSIREAWLLVNNFYYNFSDSDNIRILRYLLTFDEAFIREKAAYLLLKVYGGYYPEVIPTVFLDNHPSVMFAAIKGSFHLWYKVDFTTKAILLRYLKQALENKFVAAVAHDFMIHFSEYLKYKEEGWKELKSEQKAELWNLWAYLFPSFFKSIPEKMIQIHEARFFDTITKATYFICPEQIIILVESWLGWVDRRLTFSLPDEFGMALGEILIKGTKSNPAIRERLSLQLLSHPDTNFLFVIINDFINGWHDLTAVEQNEVLKLIQSEDKVDARWLKALALTRTDVPEEIVGVILGTNNKSTFKQGPDDIVRNMPEELLTDCLHVYSGYPQPLWWLGTHHAYDTQWDEVILTLLDQENHRSFELALRLFIGNVTSLHFFKRDEASVLSLWKRLCQSSNNQTKVSAFRYLLKNSLQKVGVYSKDLWSIFFSELNSDEQKFYLNQIVEVVEGLSYNEKLTYIFPETIVNKVLEYLPIDHISWFILSNSVMPGNEKLEFFEKMLQTEITSPRLFETYTYIRNYFINNLGLLEDLIIIMKDSLRKKAAAQKLQFEDEFELDDWNSVR